MGCSYSSFNSSPPSDCVRVIRITGHVEDLRAPVTAGQLTGRPPKDVLFSGANLSAFGSNPLRPDDRLEPGRVYFLLPHAVLRSESSAIDLAALMARLLAAAARRGPSPVLPPAAAGCRQAGVPAPGPGVEAGARTDRGALGGKVGYSLAVKGESTVIWKCQ